MSEKKVTSFLEKNENSTKEQKNIYRCNEPFGRKQMIFIGDIFKQFIQEKEDYFFLSKSFLNADPLIVNLTTNYAYNDSDLLSILNSFQTGENTDVRNELFIRDADSILAVKCNKAGRTFI